MSDTNDSAEASERFDFVGESEELLRKALRSFAAWAAQNWTMREGEAETLTDPSPCPKEYERGYNAGIENLPDAVAVWLDEVGYV